MMDRLHWTVDVELRVGKALFYIRTCSRNDNAGMVYPIDKDPIFAYSGLPDFNEVAAVFS